MVKGRANGEGSCLPTASIPGGGGLIWGDLSLWPPAVWQGKLWWNCGLFPLWRLVTVGVFRATAGVGACGVYGPYPEHEDNSTVNLKTTSL